MRLTTSENAELDHLLKDTQVPPDNMLDAMKEHASEPLWTVVLDPGDPLRSGRDFVANFYTTSDQPTLHHHGNLFFAWNQRTGTYEEREPGRMKSELYRFLEVAQCYVEGKNADTGEREKQLIPFKPTKAKVENVLDALRAVTHLPVTVTPPCWLRDDPGLDPTEILPCRNGLLHIPTRRLITPTPALFAVNGLDFKFDQEAPPPERWLNFLNNLWRDDTESRETLQEFIGYLLTPCTHLQKMALLVGPKRGGKGTIGRVLRRLCGDRNTCSPTLDAMSRQFGLAVLINKTVAVISDARISGRTDTAVIAERLLSISGEDHQTIPRKFLSDWNGKLTTRFLLMTNELPRIEDASGALASRFIILTLRRSFYGCEDHKLFDSFLPELPGILNWALVGRDRLNARGYFLQPAASDELRQQLEELSSPVQAFLREECETDPGNTVDCDALYSAWRNWCNKNGRDKPGTVQVFSRNVHATAPWLKVVRQRDGGSRVRHWEGVRLRTC